MLVDVLVYRGSSTYNAVFGHVLGTNYIFEITTILPDTMEVSNGFTQLGDGFVYRGLRTDGFDDTVVHTDGTTTTVISRDINGTSLWDPYDFTPFAGEVVFRTHGLNTSAPLVITNGTNAPKPLVNFDVEHFLVSGSYVYINNFNDLYRVDSNGNLTTLIFDTGMIDYIFEFKGAVHFRYGVGGQNDYYRVDPISGTVVELNIAETTGGNFPRFSTNGVGDNQFFYWSSFHSNGTPTGLGLELFVSDGTSAGTHLVKDIRHGESSSYIHANFATTRGDDLFFLADLGGSTGTQLWTSDGTASGTFALSGTGTTVGQLNFNGFPAMAVGNKVFFTASRSGVGYELFVTDGTVAGTRLVKDIRPGATSSDPGNFYTDGTHLYFSILGGSDSDAVWISDGTAAGTYAFSDPRPGASSGSFIRFITKLKLDSDNIPGRTLTGTPQADTLTGDYLDDTIDGLAGNDTLYGLGGNDRLFGGLGDDTLDGGAGNDRMEGGAGNDTYVVNSTGDIVVEAANAGTDTVRSTITYTLGVNVENLVLLGASALNGFGNTQANVITGNAANNVLNGRAGDDTLRGLGGNDRLIGEAGNDTLDGGVGADRMEGGLGNDTYIVDNRSDVVVELANQGTDTVRSTITYTLSANVENLVLLGTAAINGTGNALANVITGNAAANVLNGGAGNDTLNGGNGNDRLIGGAGNDTLNGGAGADQLQGDAGNDVLRGGAGNDTLLGGAGNDQLFGDAGNDILRGGLGDDILNGGAGIDTADYSDAPAEQRSFGVMVDLDWGVAWSNTLSGPNLIGDDTLISIENVIGSRYNDDLWGNAGANVLRGGAGNDYIDGDAGNDTLYGDAGNDILDGGAGADRLEGGAGNDTLLGGAGNDRLFGDAGNDTLDGGAGNDRLEGGLGNDRLTGGAGIDTLLGGAGNDVLIGGLGNDVLTGGAGRDTFLFNTALNAATNRDRITDFNVRDDTIQLENAIFTKLTATGALNPAFFKIGPAATDANDYIVYNKTTGALFYDSNGNAAGGAVQFATLAPNLALTAADFFVV